jgi:hypothetical protein
MIRLVGSIKASVRDSRHIDTRELDAPYHPSGQDGVVQSNSARLQQHPGDGSNPDPPSYTTSVNGHTSPSANNNSGATKNTRPASADDDQHASQRGNESPSHAEHSGEISQIPVHWNGRHELAQNHTSGDRRQVIPPEHQAMLQFHRWLQTMPYPRPPVTMPYSPPATLCYPPPANMSYPHPATVSYPAAVPYPFMRLPYTAAE